MTCFEHELGIYERCGQPEMRKGRIEGVTADHPPSRAVGLMEVLVRVARQSSDSASLIATHTIRLRSSALEESITAPLPMICAQDQVVFVYGRFLVRFYRDKVETLEMAGAPNRLHYSPIGRLQLAASYDTGAEIFGGTEVGGARGPWIFR
ncbi:MAG: hypothetical protein ACI8T1_003083 [Verrucomicrobiales bacterium]